MYTLRPAADLADLADLEPVARGIFGEGDRPPGWFPRKLHRERVDPRLSVLACEGDDLACVVGYALIGAPASLPGVARCAGLGLLPSARGAGLGRRLVDAARRAAAAADLRELHVLADPSSRPFYAALGFEARVDQRTLLAPALGPRAASLPPPRPWDEPHTRPLAGWLREAWEGTDDPQRGTLEVHLGGERSALAHLSREGRALLVHRLLVPLDADAADALTAADALRRRLPFGAPILLYGVADPTLVHSLETRGWSIAQASSVMTMEAWRHQSTREFGHR